VRAWPYATRLGDDTFGRALLGAWQAEAVRLARVAAAALSTRVDGAVAPIPTRAQGLDALRTVPA
jgi:sugar/nucleoside kinase (ribokinase family)